MENVTATVGWICTTQTLLEAATSILEELREVILPLSCWNDKAYLGRIGAVHVLVTSLGPQDGLCQILTKAKSMGDCYSQLPSIFVMGYSDRQNLDANLGDLLIGSVTYRETANATLNATSIMQRAIS